MNGRRLGLVVILLCVLLYQSVPSIDDVASPLDSGQSINLAQTLIYGTPYSVEEFSYWTANSEMTYQWASTIHSGLYSRQSSLNRLYGPELAANMPTVSEDGLNWTVDLKQRLLFDNGNPITAEDVVFSYKVALTPSINKNTYSELIPWFESNDSIVEIDDDSILFGLSDTYAFTLSLLTSPIIDNSLYEDRYNDCVAGDAAACDWNAEDGSDTVGTTGPFSIDSIDTTNNIVTVTNNYNYWNHEDVWAGEIIFQYISSKEAALSELAGGNIDIIDSHFAPFSDDFAGLSGIEFTSINSSSHHEISLNHLHPYFGTGDVIPGNSEVENATSREDARLVRQAISHIIDRQFIIDAIMDGGGQAVAAPFPPLLVGWNSSIPPDEYGVMTARTLMEQAGFNYNNIPMDSSNQNDTCHVTGNTSDCFFDITILSPDNGTQLSEIASHVALELQKIGIGTIHLFLDPDEINRRTEGYRSASNGSLVPLYDDGGFDLVVNHRNWGLNWDPENMYNTLGLCDSGDCSNYYNFVNETIGNIISEYQTDINITSRLEKATLIQEMLAYQKNVIPITNPQEIWTWRGDVLGFDLLLLSVNQQEWSNVRLANWINPFGIQGEVIDCTPDYEIDPERNLDYYPLIPNWFGAFVFFAVLALFVNSMIRKRYKLS